MGGRISCREMHLKVHKFCVPLVSWDNKHDYDVDEQIVIDKNQIIARATQTAMKRHPNLDIAFSDKLFHAHISIDLMASDCFHPNRYGQANISKILWEEQPWFREPTAPTGPPPPVPPASASTHTQETGNSQVSTHSHRPHVNHDGDGVVVVMKPGENPDNLQ
jgi:hypothetical protein